MSQSYSSLQQSNLHNQKDAQLLQILMISQQKDLIIQKYNDKITILQNKISELMQEIERLNWQNRQKDYNEEYIKNYQIYELVKGGFVEELQWDREQIQNIAQGKQKNCKNNEICQQKQIKNKSQSSSITNQHSQKSGKQKGYIMKVFIKQNTQQIKLQNNIIPIKYNDEVQKILESNKETNSEQRTNTKIKNQISKNYQNEFSQIEQYCLSVMKQVQGMKKKIQEQDKQKGNQIQSLKSKLLQEQSILKEKKSQIQNLRESHTSALQSIQKASQQKQSSLKKTYQQEFAQIKKQLSTSQTKYKQIIIRNQQLQIQQTLLQAKIKQFQKKNIQIQQSNQNLQKVKKELQSTVDKYDKIIKEDKSKIQGLEKKLVELERMHEENVKEYQALVELQKENKSNQYQTLPSSDHNNHTGQENFVVSKNTLQNAESQTDSGLIFEFNRKLEHNNFNRHDFCKNTSKQKLYHHRSQSEQNANNKLSLPPPSLEMIGTDYFDNSQSSQVHNKSSLGPAQNQFFSNLSSSSFGKNQKHLQQMLTTQKPFNTNQEYKHSSLKNITIPQFTQNSQSNNSHKSKQISIQGQKKNQTDLFPGFQPEFKTKKSKSKIVSYSQKNIIIQQAANQDEDHFPHDNLSQFQTPKDKQGLANSLDKERLQLKNKEESLIPSRSGRSSQQNSGQMQKEHLDENGKHQSDHIQQSGRQVASSEHPSQTYKNSLKIVDKSNEISDSNNSYHINISSKGSNVQSVSKQSQSFNFPSLLQKTSSNVHKKHSQSLKISSSNPYSIQQKASQLLQMKSPQKIMKSILQRSFPIESNPLRLSYEYLNVQQIVKSDRPKQTENGFLTKDQLKNKKQERQRQRQIERSQQSLPNIIIQTQNNKINLPNLEHQQKLQKSIQRPLPLYITPSKNEIASFENISPIPKIQKGNQKKIAQKQQGKNINVGSNKKQDFIQLADSIDFDSLKKIQLQNQTKNSAKKKQKVIYLRRR